MDAQPIIDVITGMFAGDPTDILASWGMVLAEHDGQWGIAVGTADHGGPADTRGIVDLGNGLCFRR